jgi:hypothetical protein
MELKKKKKTDTCIKASKKKNEKMKITISLKAMRNYCLQMKNPFALVFFHLTPVE